MSNRIFERVSENMHYEIFKFLNSKDLLEIRATKLGGYQLTSNLVLRSRIKNYLSKISLKYYAATIQKNDLIYEQTRQLSLVFDSSIHNDGLKYIFEHNPQITEINFGK